MKRLPTSRLDTSHDTEKRELIRVDLVIGGRIGRVICAQREMREPGCARWRMSSTRIS